MTIIKIGKWGGLLISGLLLLFMYGKFNPAESRYYPACPFHSLTGLQCPGCGSQRAVHHLLNFEFPEAFQYNPLLVIALPYVLFGLYLDRIRKPSEKKEILRKRFFGRTAIYLSLLVIFGFWFLRNL